MQTVDDSDLPTRDTGKGSATIGAYEGDDYCPKGAYRPQERCLMRALSYEGDDAQFCKVCTKRVDKVIKQRMNKLKRAGKKVCSASAGGGRGAPGSIPGDGPIAPSCLGPGACTDCLAASCEAPTTACFGPDWREGVFAGPCGAYLECFCGCSDDAASCSAQCAGESSPECTSCLTGAYASCIESSCSGTCQ